MVGLEGSSVGVSVEFLGRVIKRTRVVNASKRHEVLDHVSKKIMLRVHMTRDWVSVRVPGNMLFDPTS